MTREERLKFCTICERKAFNPKKGTICSLSGNIATFETTCPDFKENEKIAILEQKKDRDQEEDISKSINFGRYALFFLGAVYFIIAVYKTFIASDYLALESFIYWTVAVTFFTLASWSQKRALLAYQIDLVLFVMILFLHAFFSLGFLIGIIPFLAYFAVVCVFLAAIIVLKGEAKKQPIGND